MASKPVAQLLADLGVIKSHSRPRVSNDNPYSEAQFKTLKYCPDFPSRFGSLEHARQFCVKFFDAYNNDHRHSGLGLLTPAVVHAGHPDRFRRGQPRPPGTARTRVDQQARGDHRSVVLTTRCPRQVDRFRGAPPALWPWRELALFRRRGRRHEGRVPDAGGWSARPVALWGMAWQGYPVDAEGNTSASTSRTCRRRSTRTRTTCPRTAAPGRRTDPSYVRSAACRSTSTGRWQRWG